LSEPTPNNGLIKEADPVPLKSKLRKAEKKREFQAFGLILPALLFCIVFFAFPIISMLKLSVENNEVQAELPRTVEIIKTWNGKDIPNEDVFNALALDMKKAYREKTLPKAGVRLNYEIPRFRSLLIKSARRISKLPSGPYKEALIKIDERWNEIKYWAAIKRNTSSFTSHYFLKSFDLEYSENNEIKLKPDDSRIYINILMRTIWISFLITVLCLILGYPVAYFLATQPPERTAIFMFFVLVPFWTSLLVRTLAWVVLLQEHGVINDTLIWLGISEERFRLVFNRPGLIIAMTHVLLPFMILPIFSVMKRIDPHYMKAAKSLGAHPVIAFITIYIPLSKAGIGAGSLLVFILAVGYYITPELVGGPGDQFISHYIASFTNELLNWGQASALAILLLVTIIALFTVFSRYMKVGET
jgi:putative spermidine/putrescine transport system permease protein